MQHDIVGYDRNDAMLRGFRESGQNVEREFFPVRCDNQTAVWEMVKAGCGLGFGPLQAGNKEPELETIRLNIPLPKFGVWLTAHEAVRRTPRVDAVWQVLAKRLAELCDPPSAS